MIHCYSLDEKNIVIDVNSGAVHLLHGAVPLLHSRCMDEIGFR